MPQNRSAVDEALALLCAESSSPVIDADACNIVGLLQSGNEDNLVDSVLAILGFTKTSVQHGLVNTQGRTLLTLLSFRTRCQIQSFLNSLRCVACPEYQLASSLFLGSPIPQSELHNGNCQTFMEVETLGEVIKASLTFLKSSELGESLALELLDALIKVTSFTSNFKIGIPGGRLLTEGLKEVLPVGALIQIALDKRDVFYNCLCPTVRLLLWRLEPDLLWQDLSLLLQKISGRPLMSVDNELRHGHGWYNFVIAIVSAPDIFIETKNILNDWLLTSGASCVLDLKEKLTVAVLDVLEHPNLWDITTEAGAKLPPLSSFYHIRFHSAIKILARKPNWPGLQDLACLIEKEILLKRGSCSSNIGPGETSTSKSLQVENISQLLKNSLWMLLVEFPVWFQFAAYLLFLKSYETYHISSDVNSMDMEVIKFSEYQETAARYIAWLFAPHDDKLRNLVMSMLSQIVKSWMVITNQSQHSEDIRENKLVSKRRKIVLDNLQETSQLDDLNVQGNSTSNECIQSDAETANTVQIIKHWLVTFEDCCRLIYAYGGAGYENKNTSEVYDNKNASEGRRKQQPKRRLHMEEGNGFCMLEGFPSDFNASKTFSFFASFPLVALCCSPELQNEAVVNFLLHYVIFEYQCLSSNIDITSGLLLKHDNELNTSVYREERHDLACREPSHRTEDFKEPCTSNLCLQVFQNAPDSVAKGISRVFRFLEMLDLIGESGGSILGSHGNFKKMVAKQLMACICCWSEQAPKTSESVTILNDLRCRASLWLSATSLETQASKSFEKVLEKLDILISSSLAEDSLQSVYT